MCIPPPPLPPSSHLSFPSQNIGSLISKASYLSRYQIFLPPLGQFKLITTANAFCYYITINPVLWVRIGPRCWCVIMDVLSHFIVGLNYLIQVTDTHTHTCMVLAGIIQFQHMLWKDQQIKHKKNIPEFFMSLALLTYHGTVMVYIEVG